MPAAALIAGFLGFGALASAHDIPLAIAVASTALIWALPGQIVFVEMTSLGAPFVAIVLAVMLSSARFLPMTLMLMPEIRSSVHRPWKYYFAAQLLSLSGWTMAVARFPDIPRPQRLAWFCGFTLLLVTVSAMSTAAGYLGADRVPDTARLALVFTVPIYYLLILTGAVRERIAAVALACGAIAGPLAYLAVPQWSVVAGGIAGGTAAYLILRALMDLWILLAGCGAATYLWRGPGVLISAGIGARGEAFTWVSCIAYAIIAGLVSRMLLMPTGALAETTLVERALGAAAGALVYFRLTKRNLFAGIAIGAAVLWMLKV